MIITVWILTFWFARTGANSLQTSTNHDFREPISVEGPYGKVILYFSSISLGWDRELKEAN